jgi:hypothetical protein
MPQWTKARLVLKYLSMNESNPCYFELCRSKYFLVLRILTLNVDFFLFVLPWPNFGRFPLVFKDKATFEFSPPFKKGKKTFFHFNFKRKRLLRL